jgi:hypothetical protein
MCAQAKYFDPQHIHLGVSMPNHTHPTPFKPQSQEQTLPKKITQKRDCSLIGTDNLGIKVSSKSKH